MKIPPRYAQRCRPPFEVKQPRRLLPLGVLLLGLLLALAGVVRDLRSIGSEPHGHIPPYSPLPSISSFQPLGNPEATPTPVPALAASPKPTARLLHGSPSPGQALIASPAVQIWSSSDVLQPGPALAPVDSAAAQEVMPDGPNGSSLAPSPDGTHMNPGPVVGDDPAPNLSPAGTPTPAPGQTPKPTPVPSTPAPTPQSSSPPSPQPSPSSGPQTPSGDSGGGKRHSKPSSTPPGLSQGSTGASGG